MIHLRKPNEPVQPQHMTPPEPARVSPRAKRRWGIPLIVIGAFLAGALIGFAVRPANRPVSGAETYAPPAGTKPAPHTETDIVKAAGHLIELPDETPSVATVTDLAPLREQAFFANAALGDVVLMFPEARKALLYRPSLNRLIEAAPLSLSQ